MSRTAAARSRAKGATAISRCSSSAFRTASTSIRASFFRSIPGQVNNGYECQIRNEYKDGDRNQPIDFGTGGIYRRQPARRVTADDFAWFPMTLVVTGKHMAAWVNGIQVSDWTDTRRPHDNPRNGLRTEPGTLQIQGHDPTTDLSFRKLQIAEVPKR